MRNRVPVKWSLAIIFSCSLLLIIGLIKRPLTFLEAATSVEMQPLSVSVDDQADDSGSDGTQAYDKSPNKVDEAVLKEEEEFYTVKKGQTLWEISQATGTSMADLMKKNQLVNSLIFEGQYLIVNKAA